MTLVEDIISKRELMVFIGEENHSSSFNPCLFNSIWIIPESIPSKEVLIIPIQNLDDSYRMSKEKIMCYGKPFWILFVRSTFLIHNAILIDTFPQADNTYFTNECISFLQRSNCRAVAICDIGVYKSASLIRLLNSAIRTLATQNISVCLATILGYNTRGFTDIETGDEHSVYVKNYYLKPNHNIYDSPNTDVKAVNESFCFIQINKKFNLRDLLYICSLTKNPAEKKLQELKVEAKGYEEILKPLWDRNVIRLVLKSFDKGDTFDFSSLDNKLKMWGFNGSLTDREWPFLYDKLCQNIYKSDKNNRGYYVQELISAIGKNINSTISYIKSI